MTDTGTDTGLLYQTLSRLFDERSGAETRQAAEAEGWATDCWDALHDSGLPWVGVPEAAGGSGGDIHDAFTLVRLTGRHAVPLPLAEGGLLGGWLAATAQLRVPDDGPLTVATPRPEDRVTLTKGGRVTAALARVPWGRRAAAVAAVAVSPEGPRVVLLNPGEAHVTPGHNVAGEPRDALSWDDVALPSDRIGVSTTTVDPGPELQLRGALSRALLMAGAMESVAEITVEYSGQRHQFGKAIATFQAVAHRLVRLSSEVEAGSLAADVAARCFAVATPATDAAFEVGVAKVSTGRAASEVAAHAHQVHGAIGMTQEYVLHHFTRRLWAWRQEWGSGRYWSGLVGRQVAAAGADALWPRVATGLVATAPPA